MRPYPWPLDLRKTHDGRRNALNVQKPAIRGGMFEPIQRPSIPRVWPTGSGMQAPSFDDRFANGRPTTHCRMPTCQEATCTTHRSTLPMRMRPAPPKRSKSNAWMAACGRRPKSYQQHTAVVQRRPARHNRRANLFDGSPCFDLSPFLTQSVACLLASTRINHAPHRNTLFESDGTLGYATWRHVHNGLCPDISPDSPTQIPPS